MRDSGLLWPDFNIDICLCIDKTGSMRPLIDTVKRNALNLCRDIQNHFEAGGKHVNRLRVRIICFGDYKADKEPMILSPFLTLPEDNEKFESLVNGIQAGGEETNQKTRLKRLLMQCVQIGVKIAGEDAISLHCLLMRLLMNWASERMKQHIQKQECPRILASFPKCGEMKISLA